MFKLGKDKTLTKIEETTFVKLGLKERTDIQELICSNPQILGEELLIVAKEFDGFEGTNERLDLMAIDKQGNLVVIENKRDDSGRDVTWQAIKYASYCSTLSREQVISIYRDYIKKNVLDIDVEQSISDFLRSDALDAFPTDRQRIILVSHKFRNEVLSAAEWLLNQNIDIKCVSITPFIVNGETIFDNNVILPKEENREYILKLAQKKADQNLNAKAENTTKEDRRKFWTAFAEAFDNVGETSMKNRTIADCDRATVGGSTGMGGPRTGYNLCIRNDEIKIWLYIDAIKGREFNNAIFDYIYEHKDQVERVLAPHLVEWNRRSDDQSCSIGISKKGLSFKNKEDWPEIFEWFKSNIVVFEKAFKPYVAHIKEMYKKQPDLVD